MADVPSSLLRFFPKEEECLCSPMKSFVAGHLKEAVSRFGRLLYSAKCIWPPDIEDSRGDKSEGQSSVYFNARAYEVAIPQRDFEYRQEPNGDAYN